MSKTVSLSVHKNTVERRRKRELAKDVQGQVEALIREADVRAFAFVAIDANGKAHARWDTGAILPMWAFPATVMEVLKLDMEQSGADEDWKPNLTVKGSK